MLADRRFRIALSRLPLVGNQAAHEACSYTSVDIQVSLHMITLHAKRLNQYTPHCCVELIGDEKTLQNILEKLRIYRNVDSDLRQINPDDIKPAMDVLLKR